MERNGFFAFLMTMIKQKIILYALIMSRTRSRVNSHSIVAWMSRNSLLETGTKSEVQVTATRLEPITT